MSPRITPAILELCCRVAWDVVAVGFAPSTWGPRGLWATATPEQRALTERAVRAEIAYVVDDVLPPSATTMDAVIRAAVRACWVGGLAVRAEAGA